MLIVIKYFNYSKLKIANIDNSIEFKSQSVDRKFEYLNPVEDSYLARYSENTKLLRRVVNEYKINRIKSPILQLNPMIFYSRLSSRITPIPHTYNVMFPCIHAIEGQRTSLCSKSLHATLHFLA